MSSRRSLSTSHRSPLRVPPPAHSCLLTRDGKIRAGERVCQYVGELVRLHDAEVGAFEVANIARFEVRPVNGVVAHDGVLVELADAIVFKRNPKPLESLCLCADAGQENNSISLIGFVIFNGLAPSNILI